VPENVFCVVVSIIEAEKREVGWGVKKSISNVCPTILHMIKLNPDRMSEVHLVT
jgi:hypothetical protein